MMTHNDQLMLYFLKVALGKATTVDLPNATFDKNTLLEAAMKQCITAVVFDGMRQWMAAQPATTVSYDEKVSKLKWMAMAMKAEKKYAKHQKAMAELAELYGQVGIRMMVLKGYGLAQYWPIPAHRGLGDIDIFLTYASDHQCTDTMPAWQRGDEALKQRLGIAIDGSHHHHSVFVYDNLMVENHFDFINVHSHRSNRWIENVFKQLAAESHEELTLDNGAIIAVPSPTLNCLFTARHTAVHFAAEHMNLRQLTDWALLIEHRHADIDWTLFWDMCRKMGMEKFVLCQAFIAIEQLGFDRQLFHIPESQAQFGTKEHTLIMRVLDNILHRTDEGNYGKGIAYIINRAKLWQSNIWKHRIVYKDSVLSTVMTQVKSHLMKPTTFLGE